MATMSAGDSTTQPAGFRFAQIPALSAFVHVADRLSQRFRERLGPCSVRLQQVQRHALRSLRADPREHLKRLDELVDERADSH